MKNFDRVADVYDETRGIPESVGVRLADRAIAVTHATSETRFLEIGVGTGRIAMSFLQRGCDYTGIDVSERMMDRFRAKVEGCDFRLTLVNGDVTRLPFPDASFDVVLGVHILHLVPEWRVALMEARRVLKPGGFVLFGHEPSMPGDPDYAMRRQWQRFVADAGITLSVRPGNAAAIDAELISQGAYSAVYRVAQWKEEIRPRDLLEQQLNRVFSHSWEVPDDVLRSVHARMVPWVTEQYGSLDAKVDSEHEFMLDVHQFPQ